MPLKSEIEGGKSFLNRTDNMLVIHRMPKSESMKYYTMISTEKIKDLDSGGSYTPMNQPVLFEFNKGLGFKTSGIDSLSDLRPGGVISNSFPVKSDPGNILPF
jgi:hypothetical protein